MADILMDNESIPSTPASGKVLIYSDSTTKRLATLDDAAAVHGVLSSNSSTAAQGALATTEVYLTSSNLLIPTGGLKVGMMAVWHISATKTAAGVAAPIWTYRVGAAGTVADTSRLALTSGLIQTATVADGVLTAAIHVRTGGASGVIAGSGGAGTPGFGGGGTGASSAFDLTATGGQYIGLTVTTGASAAWTVNATFCVLMG